MKASPVKPSSVIEPPKVPINFSAQGAGDSFKSYLQTVTDNWNKIDSKVSATTPHLPEELQSLFRLQVAVNNLGLQVNLLSKVAECFSGSVRQLQQGAAA